LFNMMEDARAHPEVRVLVVDDNVDTATSLGYLLELMGAKTAIAFGGDMALRMVHLFHPELVLVDWRMPGLDGCEVMRQARALPEREDGTLFACFSGCRDEADRRRCFEAGFDYFLTKPLDPSALGHVLEAARHARYGASATATPVEARSAKALHAQRE
jgi:CheY-like chemotaxis protein